MWVTGGTVARSSRFVARVAKNIRPYRREQAERSLGQVTDPIEDLRASATALRRDEPAMAAYAEHVRTRAYSLTDADLDALKAAGFSEDEIFEQTVAVAIEEGLRRL